MSLRVLAPTITSSSNGEWRMYFESRGSADRPTVIGSAVSSDLLRWELEDGIRLQYPGGVGGPRYRPLPDGQGRLYCFRSEFGPGGLASGQRISSSIVSAITLDGLNFDFESGYRLRDRQTNDDTAGITAAEVFLPQATRNQWLMYYSAWQDVPPGTSIPRHPSLDPDAVANGTSEDFAAASIASDLSGYRSRIHLAHSADGLIWKRAGCVIEGQGYEEEGLDAVHAEDMSLVEIGNGNYRMYYAACDKHGNWRIASAVTD